MKKKILGAVMVAAVTSAVYLSGCTLGESAKNIDGNVPAASYEGPISEARNTPVVRVAKAVSPSVVGITNKAIVRDWFNNPVETSGVGSGVIFREDGYIVTNNHVIENAREIVVSLADGTTLQGKVVGADAATDIAVVKVEGTNLTAAKFGDSDKLVVGEPAIAIGNPLGLEFQGSVTTGIISALNRKIDIVDIRLIQTDAPINPGNSGGALCNADGEVIGINGAKLAANGIEGMGFAIPINTVQKIINDIIEKGYVVRPYLGVVIFDERTALQYGYQLNIEKGVYVYRVTLGSGAANAGIKPNDVILEVDGKEVNTVEEVRSIIASHKVGDAVEVTIDRNNKKQKVKVTLSEMPKE
ncbi:MAG: trypsin-like peptidase domain-containing protein [Selenomonadaceae bacterium]|nr:trypsin-like peptidase domain-containing protein [Selenomonadaceae bacterium]